MQTLNLVQIRIRICTTTEYEDGGAMMSRNQDGQAMNISLGVCEWKQVRKCGGCDGFGGQKVPVGFVVCYALLG
jgi:hypothetical protein